MEMNDIITITKIETAHRLLKTAIELWFADSDPVPIHTLSAAAYQIVHDLNAHNKGPTLLFDTKNIKDEYRAEFISTLKKASNFMKHAEKAKGDKSKSVEFIPDLNEQFILFTIFGLKYLKENLTTEEIAFERWQMFQNPNLLPDAGKEVFDCTFTSESIETIRGIKKSEFLQAFIQLLRLK